MSTTKKTVAKPKAPAKPKKTAVPKAAPSSPEPTTYTVAPYAVVVKEPVLPAVTYRVEEVGTRKEFGTHSHTLVIDRKGKALKHAFEGEPTEADIQRLVFGR